MNKYKKAWDNLDSHAIHGIAPKGNQDLACLLELVEKDISKKVIRKDGYLPKCPSCYIILPFYLEKRNYCHDCSQSLDWSEE